MIYDKRIFSTVLSEDMITKEFQKLDVELSTDRNPAYNYSN